jgi:cell division protein FtsB
MSQSGPLYKCVLCGETDPEKFYATKGRKRCRKCILLSEKIKKIECKKAHSSTDKSHHEPASSSPADKSHHEPTSSSPADKSHHEPTSSSAVSDDPVRPDVNDDIMRRFDTLNMIDSDEYRAKIGMSWREEMDNAAERGRLDHTKLGSLELMFNMFKEEMKGLTDSHQEGITGVIDDVNGLIQNYNVIEERIVEQTSTIDTLRNENDTLRRENESLKSEQTSTVDALRKENESLKSRQDSIESTVNNMFSELRNELDGYKRELDALKARPVSPVASAYKPSMMLSYSTIPRQTTPVRTPNPMSFQSYSPKPTSQMGFGGGPGGYPLASAPRTVTGPPGSYSFGPNHYGSGVSTYVVPPDREGH